MRQWSVKQFNVLAWQLSSSLSFINTRGIAIVTETEYGEGECILLHVMILNFYLSVSAHFVCLRDIQIWLAFRKEIETFYSWSNTVVYQSALISLSTHIFPLDCAFHLSRSLLFKLLVEVYTVSVWYNEAWICCLFKFSLEMQGNKVTGM